MRSVLFLFAALLALAGFAADAPADAPAAKKPARQAKSQNQLPDSVEGVPAEEYAKIRRALLMSYGNETISVARKRLNELRSARASPTDARKPKTSVWISRKPAMRW